MENEEKIRQEARRRLEEQLKQYRVQRHTERVSQQMRTVSFYEKNKICIIYSGLPWSRKGKNDKKAL